MTTSENNICQELEALLHGSPEENVTLETIVHRLRERGFGMLMMVLVLPNCVPIPIPPGMSTLFSLPLLFLTAQMLLGRTEPWVPAKLAKKPIKMHYLRSVLTRIMPPLQHLQKYVRPRLSFTHSKAGERFVGFCWFLFALSIAVPMPMTNFLPGTGILISALGLMGRDGYIILGGLAVGSIGVLITTQLLLLGSDAIQSLF